MTDTPKTFTENCLIETFIKELRIMTRITIDIIDNKIAIKNVT